MAVDARNLVETRSYNQLDAFKARTSCEVWGQCVYPLVMLHGISPKQISRTHQEVVFMTKTVCNCTDFRTVSRLCTLNAFSTTGLSASWCVSRLCVQYIFYFLTFFFKFRHFQWTTDLSQRRLAQHATE